MRSQVFMAMKIQVMAFWVVTLCSNTERYQRLGVTIQTTIFPLFFLWTFPMPKFIAWMHSHFSQQVMKYKSTNSLRWSKNLLPFMEPQCSLLHSWAPHAVSMHKISLTSGAFTLRGCKSLIQPPSQRTTSCRVSCKITYRNTQRNLTVHKTRVRELSRLQL